MKLVRDYHYEGDAKALSKKLRSKGILSFIAPSKAAPNKPMSGLYKQHKFRVGVWVVLENQYSDALGLSKGSRHKVGNPLTEEEMRAIELNIEKLKINKRERYYMMTSYIIVGVIVLVIIYNIFLKP